MRNKLVVCAMSVVPALTRPSVAAHCSWQEPRAKVLSSGDLEWASQPFVFEKGDSVRHIDFAKGSGANDGRLYMRLPGDRDPNTVRVEVAWRLNLIDSKKIRITRLQMAVLSA